MHGISFNSFLHLPGLLRDRGATEFEIGLIFGIGAVAGIVVKPLVGREIDRTGPRSVILASGALAALGCCGYVALARSATPVPWICFLRAVQGASMASLFTALYAHTAEIVPASRRIEGLGIFGISGTLSIGLGGILGDVLLRGGDYQVLFIAAAVASSLGFALSIPLRVAHQARVDTKGQFTVAVLQRDMLPLWFAGVLLASMVATYSTFLKTYVQSTGAGSVGLFFSVYSAGNIAVRMAFGKVPERVGPKRVLYPALGCIALGFLVLASTSSTWGVALSGLLYGIGQGYAFPIFIGLVVGRAKSDQRGSALAVFTSFFDAGTLVGSPLFGFMVRATGYSAMFVSAGLVLVAGTVLFARWERAALRPSMAAKRALS
ncbi:MFS transporter [Pendulispora rubella]|uniref:MFS transporter n=2 Tax=Pendulispora rubella TaxID=2741070 RepID=A0ABZ2LHN7_9BACT